eukprot:scaffold55506_cov59-Phaeocystis_antarctica.AAC.2
MATEMTVMSASALAQPAKVSSFEVRAASSAAMKNVLSPRLGLGAKARVKVGLGLEKVLSPISERKMSEKDGARSAERLSSAAYAARLSRTGELPVSAKKPTPKASVKPSSPIVRRLSPAVVALVATGASASISA